MEQFSSLGGGQRCLIDLLPEFVQQGWKPRAAVPGEGAFCEMVRALAVPIHILDNAHYKSKHGSWKFAKYAMDIQGSARQLRHIAAMHGVDLLYVNGTRMLPAAALTGHARRIPVILHCHHRLDEKLAILLTHHCLAAADAHVICCSQSTAEPLRPYLSAKRLAVVYNGVAGFGSGLRIPVQSPRRIGVIGRFEEGKGQLEFVYAARSVLTRFPDAQFSIIGEPLFTNGNYKERVKSAARGLPVEFAGWQDDIGAVLSQLDLLAVPSTETEALPRVILEAFAAGVPVVAFPSGGIPEIVRDSQTGFLTDASTPEALAGKLCSILAMPLSRLAEIATNAYDAWRTQFTLSRYQRQVAEIVARAVNEKGAIGRPPKRMGVTSGREMQPAGSSAVPFRAAGTDGE